jgi:hypothetical protein
LVPRPIERHRKPTGYGSEAVYPSGTRAQLQRQVELEQFGVRGEVNQRLHLWLDGFPIPSHRVTADLKAVCDALLTAAVEVGQGFEADHLVLKMLDGHEPSKFIAWARRRLPRRSDLEAALLQTVQLATGTPPSELMLDPDSARPLQQLLNSMFPAAVATAEQLAELDSLDGAFAEFMRAVASLPDWSSEQWVAARDDQALLMRAGYLPSPAPELGGAVLLPMRLAFAIGCGAMRQLGPGRWQSRIDEVRLAIKVPPAIPAPFAGCEQPHEKVG